MSDVKDESKTEASVVITSSEQPRIKDPKRVEAGRRLGAISKAAKEKKARERYDREAALARESEIDWTTPIGIGVVVLTLGLCYVMYSKRQRDSNKPQAQPSEGAPDREYPTPHERGDTSTRPAPRFESLGD